MEEARKQALNGVVVGIGALTGETTPRIRYDIDVMMRDQAETFNLFLIALSRYRKIKASLVTSRSLVRSVSHQPSAFANHLKGIHGLPTTTWDSVQKKIQDRFSGYCAHGVMAFPTWHRARILHCSR